MPDAPPSDDDCRLVLGILRTWDAHAAEHDLPPWCDSGEIATVAPRTQAHVETVLRHLETQGKVRHAPSDVEPAPGRIVAWAYVPLADRPASQLPEPGWIVQHPRWRTTGTIRRVEGEEVFVAWHGTCVEDQLHADEVEIIGPPSERDRWAAGGLGLIEPDGTSHVAPVIELGLQPPVTDQ